MHTHTKDKMLVQPTMHNAEIQHNVVNLQQHDAPRISFADLDLDSLQMSFLVHTTVPTRRCNCAHTCAAYCCL